MVDESVRSPDRRIDETTVLVSQPTEYAMERGDDCQVCIDETVYVGTVVDFTKKKAVVEL